MEGNVGGAAAPSAVTGGTQSPQSASSSDSKSSGVELNSSTHKSPNSTPVSSQQEVFEVKVNGKTVKMTRQEAIDHASMSYAANEKFNEASKIRKQVDQIVSKAKSNPIEALMDPALGLSKDQIRDAFEKWYSKEFIETESLNEDQKKLRAAEDRLRQIDEEAAARKLQEDQEQESKLTNQQREFLQNEIVSAMEASGLPKTKWLASRMAFYMRHNLNNGWEAPQSLIIQQVKNERAAMMSDISKDATAEQLISMLGDDVINKIRKYDLEQLRSRRNLPPASVSNGKQSSPYSKGKTSYADVKQRLQDMRSGKITY